MADFLISSSKFPDQPEGKVAVFKDLAGGLNLWQLDYRMAPDQSPEMKNLWWRDGLLGCRDGQEYTSDTLLGKGLCCFDRLFWGHMIAHIGDGLYAAVPGEKMEPVRLCDGLPEIRGTFLRYHDALLYKTQGAYKKILWKDDTLQVEEIEPYVPVTVINCTTDGAGDLYQPENRLSPKKTVWFNAAVNTCNAVIEVTSSGSRSCSIKAENNEPIASVEHVYINTTLQDESDYTVAENKKTITFTQDLQKDDIVTVVYTVGIREYHLPDTQIDSIEQVLVDEEPVTEYEADPETGVITFTTAPAVQDPPVNNTVKITYSKENPDAYNAIMDCRYACAYGGTGGAVLIMAGSRAQPNAYFWNGSHVAMDMGYFPVSNYNLAGDDLEPVTGFGEQSGSLVIFKQRAVGKGQLTSTTVDDRAYLSVDYTPINNSIGCDLPWTIRLVGNCLVWCNTYTGVCRLEETTAALENYVRCISRNILGCDARPGLLKAVRYADTVCALEDGDRYWVVADGKAYLWDHAISSPGAPSWFYFTNIPAVSFLRADNIPEEEDDGLAYTGAQRIYHLDAYGRISRFVRTFRDYGGAIEKVYTFATQDFGDPERRKHLRKLIVSTRSDTDSVIEMEYSTDHAQRKELTPIRCYSWKLRPRNLAFRFLGVRKFLHTAVRVPGCRYIRCFSLRLHNNQPGSDMAVVSARFYADLVIKER